METGFSCRDVTSNLHTQPPGPGWEPAPASYTQRRQREQKLRAAERRGPASLGTGAPAAHASPAGRPETDASPITAEARSQPR